MFSWIVSGFGPLTLAWRCGLARDDAAAWGEPREFRLFAKFECGPHQMDVSLRRRFRLRRLEVDEFQHPIVIDRGAATVARQQRRRDARDAGQQNLVERLFQHVQTRDADDRIDVAADDDLQHNRRAFRHQHLVAEFLGAPFEVGDGTGAALLAIEAKLVVVGRTPLGVFEAVRQQQQTAVERHGLNLLAPDFIGDAHHREAEILLTQPHLPQQFLGEGPHFLLGRRFGAVEVFAEARRLGAEATRNSRGSGTTLN